MSRNIQANIARFFLKRRNVLIALSASIAIGALVTVYAGIGLMAAFGLILAIASSQLELDIHDILLPRRVYDRSLAYRCQFYVLWVCLFTMLAGAGFLYIAGGILQYLLVCVGVVMAAHLCMRAIEVVNHAEAHLEHDAPINLPLLEMQPKFIRWLTNGKSIEFPWNKRK